MQDTSRLVAVAYILDLIPTVKHLFLFNLFFAIGAKLYSYSRSLGLKNSELIFAG